MKNQDRVALLIRLARKVPEESPVLLQWAEELLSADGNNVGSSNGKDRSGDQQVVASLNLSPIVRFPLPIHIDSRGKRINGVLYSDCRVQINGHTYNSPSQAATTELGYSEDGWRKITFTDGNGLDQPIDLLRQSGIIGRPPRKRRV